MIQGIVEIKSINMPEKLNLRAFNIRVCSESDKKSLKG